MRTRRNTALVGTALLALVLALVASSDALTGSARAAEGFHRLGSAPKLPAHARTVGALSARKQLTVDVTLAVRDQSALDAYAQAVSTPGSADYHRYLTVGELRQRFAPTNAQIEVVRKSLERAGLRPGRVSANGLVIKVTASAAKLGSAFHTNFARVRLAGGRVGYTNTTAPEVSASIAGTVQGIVGLNSLQAPHALGLAREKGTGHAKADAKRADETASTASAPTPGVSCGASSTAMSDGAYTANEVASAYGFTGLYNNGDFGSGQTVALIEFEKYSSSDIAAYESCYGISAPYWTTTIDGGASGSSAGSGEAALDIEQVAGLAPSASINVYEAPDTDAGSIDVLQGILNNSGVNIVSTSWGECEYLMDSDNASAAVEENTIFKEMAIAGKSVYAAAGDSGSTDCDGESDAHAYEDALEVDDPGSQPYVTSVGGTTLDNDTAADQSVWNDVSIANGAGGGGLSVNWTMPSYQRSAASALNVINANSSASPCNAGSSGYCREVPDVSADADPQTGYVIYYSGDVTRRQPNPWQAIAGTSAAAPLWAALTALANASSYCSGTAVGFANPVLYTVAGSDYANTFTDITTGNNNYLSANGGLYPAGTGYDLATGLGTPNASALIPDMCATRTGSAIGSSGSLFTGNSSYNSAGATVTTPVTTTPTTSSSGGGGTSTTTSTTSSTSTTTSSTPTPAPITTPVATTTTGSTVTTATSKTTSCKLTSLHSAAAALAVSKAAKSRTLSLSFTLPSGCSTATLSLQRHIATTEARTAKAVDTLKLELLSGSKLVTTLATLNNRNAAAGYQTLSFNLARYAGKKLTLRLLATRGGPKATTFTLRSVALRLS